MVRNRHHVYRIHPVQNIVCFSFLCFLFYIFYKLKEIKVHTDIYWIMKTVGKGRKTSSRAGRSGERSGGTGDWCVEVCLSSIIKWFASQMIVTLHFLCDQLTSNMIRWYFTWMMVLYGGTRPGHVRAPVAGSTQCYTWWPDLLSQSLQTEPRHKSILTSERNVYRYTWKTDELELCPVHEYTRCIL